MIRKIRTLKVEPVKVGHEHPTRVIGMKENIAIKSETAKSGGRASDTNYWYAEKTY